MVQRECNENSSTLSRRKEYLRAYLLTQYELICYVYADYIKIHGPSHLVDTPN